MLQEAEIKEHLSRNSFKTIANVCGYKCSPPGDGDHGVDFDVKEVSVVERPQGNRVIETGRVIQVQLKATIESRVSYTETSIKYDLEVKTYNDLIERAQVGAYPLYLVLAVLPLNASLWVQVGARRVTQATQLFWFKPDSSLVLSDNSSRVRIEVPVAQRVDKHCLTQLFRQEFTA